MNLAEAVEEAEEVVEAVPEAEAVSEGAEAVAVGDSGGHPAEVVEACHGVEAVVASEEDVGRNYDLNGVCECVR